MSSPVSFDAPANKPRIPRDRPPFAVRLLSTRLRLALANIDSRDPAHRRAAREQVQAALDQIEGA